MQVSICGIGFTTHVGMYMMTILLWIYYDHNSSNEPDMNLMRHSYNDCFLALFFLTAIGL